MTHVWNHQVEKRCTLRIIGPSQKKKGLDVFICREKFWISSPHQPCTTKRQHCLAKTQRWVKSNSGVSSNVGDSADVKVKVGKTQQELEKPQKYVDLFVEMLYWKIKGAGNSICWLSFYYIITCFFLRYTSGWMILFAHHPIPWKKWYTLPETIYIYVYVT